MARPFRFRPSRREIISANNAAITFYAGASENPKAQENLAKLLVPEPPKRNCVKRCDGKPIVPLEADVIRAVSQLLAVHPNVLYALRMNSGAASYEAASGKFAPVWFHIWVRAPEKVRMSDFYGATRDSRILALECKRPGWTAPTNKREYEQAAFLMLVRNAGGIGEFVTDAEQVECLLR